MDDVGTVDADPPIGLEYVRTLEYFEGDLLVEARGSDGSTYLYSWVNSDRVCNRWLVSKVTREALERYLAGKCSLRTLILESLGEHLYLVDLDSEHRPRRVAAVTRDGLPADYLPSDNAYYDVSLAPQE